MTELFKGFPYPIVNKARGYFGHTRGVQQIKADLLILLLTSPGERCLVGDTKIPLADGTEWLIKDLVGKDCFWVYSYDKESNSIVAGKATAKQTAFNAELVEVVLDNGEKVRCTPDHLWLLRDGTYRRADELDTGTSLMPLYRNTNTSGYERIYQPYLRDYRETHLNFVINKRLSGVREVVHHKDLNKRNNSPENLQWMTCQDHKDLHKVIRDAFKNKFDNDEKFRQSWLEKMKAGLKRYYESHDGNRKGAMLSQETRKKLSENKSIFYDSEEGQEAKDKIRHKLLEHFKTHDNPMLGRNHTEEAKAKMRGSRPNMKGDNNPARRPETSEKNKLAWIKRRELSLANCTEEEKRQKHEKAQAAWQKRKLREQNRQKNHNVISVVKLTEKEDCYDLMVEVYHNFALSAGVFVHNCMLPDFGTPLKDLIFEPNDAAVVSRAKQMVINSISQWEPRIVVNNINVTNTVPTSYLNQNDDLTEIKRILTITIQFTDPENILEQQELVLDVPLPAE